MRQSPYSWDYLNLLQDDGSSKRCMKSCDDNYEMDSSILYFTFARGNFKQKNQCKACEPYEFYDPDKRVCVSQCDRLDVSSGINYCRNATYCPITADGRCVHECQHFRYEREDGTVLCVNFCPPDGKYDISNGIKICSASGANQIVEDNPLCDAMLRDNVF